jgi:arylsulfatase A-like enzyme
MAAREIRFEATLLSLVIALAALGCERAKMPTSPNVVLIVVDTLRADHLGCYGYARNTTPHLDRLAAASIRFDTALSTSSWTLPAVASLMTSQSPSAHGIRDKPKKLDERFPLLSELLRKNGYRTQGFVSHGMVSARLGFGRGFDAYDEESAGHGAISSPIVTDQAVAFLRNVGDQPFFLFLHYFDPHYNFQQHEGHDFGGRYEGPLGSGEPILQLWKKLKHLSPDDIAYLISLYDSEIAFTDHHIGAVLAELDRQGVLADTIVIVTADHGEEFMERGWLGHSITLHHELIRVPLIMKLPGVTPRVVDTPVSLMDVAPTLLGFLGIEIPPDLDGRALDLRSGRDVPIAPVFSETFNPQVHRPGGAKRLALQSVVVGNHKLIYNGLRRRAELYDLSADPAERRDLRQAGTGDLEALQALLDTWTERTASKRRDDAEESVEDPFTPEQRERLKALGYL